MAAITGGLLFRLNSPLQNGFKFGRGRLFHTSSVVSTVQAGKVKSSPKGNKPVTYEQMVPPSQIGLRKAWNSWNTTTLKGGLRSAETAIEDLFIRKFINGTFIGLVKSEILIKRQHNIIRIGFICQSKVIPERFCFLIGFSEEILSHFLHCIVKLELQVVSDGKDVVFRYI